jgi:hypothetical protein
MMIILDSQIFFIKNGEKERAMDRKEAAQRAAKLAAGAAITAVCPPAGIGLGIVGFLRGARRYAHSGDVRAAEEMITGYCGALSGGDSALIFHVGDNFVSLLIRPVV